MKRSRQDPHSYLGGDIPSLSSSSSSLSSSSSSSPPPLSKRAKNALRKELNRRWKTVDRLPGSGVDPNPRHTLYFQAQIPELLQVPGEWTRLQQALCNPLPVTFRSSICSCPPACLRSLAARLSSPEFRTMQGRFLELHGKVVKEDVVKPVVDWVSPSTSGNESDCRVWVWQLIVDSITLAKEPALSSLSAYLRREVALGHVVRQELASMLPALLLDLQSHHIVLDVCAAPGSKTEQMISLMRGGSGLVLANDADPRRIETLQRRYRRCGSPNLLVTCARAEDLSAAISNVGVGVGGDGGGGDGGGGGVFDRIVADVPCSGDGTIRKFPHIWRLFRPRVALELHSIQLQIAVASVRMLKPGGRMVYSTCSINPIEDEAVVAALLGHFQGSLRLIPATLPGLRSRPGLSTWQVSNEVFSIGEPDEEARKATVAKLPTLLPSMYPPPSMGARDLHLEYCHRILPHDQDTGGFFVAVLELVAAIPTTKKTGEKKTKKIVSQEESLRTMRQLGYNPAAAVAVAAIEAGAKAEAEAGIKYEAPAPDVDLGFVEGSHMGRGLLTKGKGHGDENGHTFYLVQSSQSTHMEAAANEDVVNNKEEDGSESEDERDDKDKDRDGDGNGIFGSRSNGWLKPLPLPPARSSGGECCFLSLVSPGIEAALRTWAKRVPVQKAGVEIGAFYRSETTNDDVEFVMHADAARSVFRCLDTSSSSPPSIALPLVEFISLCRDGARELSSTESLPSVKVTERLAGHEWSTRLSQDQKMSSATTGYIFVSVAAADLSPQQAPQAQAEAKRRLSKAERKALKQQSSSSSSNPSTSSVVVSQSLSAQWPSRAQAQDFSGLVLVLQYRSSQLCFVTPADTCASYAAALTIL